MLKKLLELFRWNIIVARWKRAQKRSAPLYIYGAGVYGHYALHACEQYGLKVTAFVVTKLGIESKGLVKSTANDTVFLGYPVKTLDQLLEEGLDVKTAIFFIGLEKDAVSSNLRELGITNILHFKKYDVLGDYRYLKPFKYVANLREINKRKSEYDKPKFAFIFPNRPVWNSLAAIYDACVKAGAEAIVICIDDSGFGDEKNYKLCLERGISAINYVEASGGASFDLRAYAPDYVFYTINYVDMYPYSLKPAVVSTYAKVCQIIYGNYSGITLSNGEVDLNTKFLSNTYLKFASHPWLCAAFKRKFLINYLFRAGQCQYLGHPRYDLLFDGEEKKSERKSVLWLPRFDTSQLVDNEGSHFLEYLTSFISFVKAHPEVDFIVRPHPNTWISLVKYLGMSQEAVDELREELMAPANVTLDENWDYLPALKDADIMLSDYSSLLMEFYLLGKPIVFTDKIPDKVWGDWISMYESMYSGQNWESLERHLTALLAGEDPRYEQRQDIIKKFLPANVGHIGEDIYQFILRDFEKYHR